MKHLFDELNHENASNNDLGTLLKGCESPIETYFLEECVKHLDSTTIVNGQVNLQTSSGTKRIDFVLVNNNYKIGIECDGSEFHYFELDLIRDYILITEKHLDSIIRFTGSDLYKYQELCLWFLAHEHPDFFSKRGQQVLENTFRLHPLKPYLPDRPPDLDLIALYNSSQTIFLDFVRRNNVTFKEGSSLTNLAKTLILRGNNVSLF